MAEPEEKKGAGDEEGEGEGEGEGEAVDFVVAYLEVQESLCWISLCFRLYFARLLAFSTHPIPFCIAQML